MPVGTPTKRSRITPSPVSVTTTTETELVAAHSVAGVKVYLTGVVVQNNSGTNTGVQFRDGATARFNLPAPSRSGAVSHLFGEPIEMTAGNNVRIAATTAATTLIVTGLGYYGA